MEAWAIVERIGRGVVRRRKRLAVITTLAVFRFDAATREMLLASTHPGVTVEQVRAETGWPPRAAATRAETPAPTAEELAVIRRFDPAGFWTRGRG